VPDAGRGYIGSRPPTARSRTDTDLTNAGPAFLSPKWAVRDGMQNIRGIPVSAGVASGPALVLDVDGIRVPQRRVAPNQVEAEIARLHGALSAAAFEATQIQRDITQKLGAKYGAVFAAHAVLFEDPAFLSELDGLIRMQRFTAEYAVSKAVSDFVKTIESLGESSFLAWRSSDFFDIERRILKFLLGIATSR